MKDQKKTEKLNERELKETTGGSMGTSGGGTGSSSGMGGGSVNPPSDWMFGNVFEEGQQGTGGGSTDGGVSGSSGMGDMGSSSMS